jgi:arylsulfatase A-like enzyme
MQPQHLLSPAGAGLAAVLALGSLTAAEPAAPPAPSRPNILFILTDDQSHRTIGAYEEADPWVRTPQIDTLARGGIRFRHAYIGTWCMPARLSLLTGRLPHAVDSMRMTGNYPGATYDPQRAPFWPRVFREHGYATAHIGKWHLGADTGYGRDWDYQVSWSRPEQKSATDNSGYYEDQLLSINGAAPVRVPGYATDNYTRWAEEFLAGRNRPADRPWLLWLCYTAPHSPYTPAERHRADYPGATVPVPADIYPPRPGKPAYAQAIRHWVPDEAGRPRYRRSYGQPLDEGVRQYNQVVSGLDEAVGRLMATLRATGQLENTLVIFASDQGFAWGQHGFSMKVAPYDANLRAPLIFSFAGVLPAGRVVEAPVSGPDLVPTIFRFAGIPLPWRMHGHDLTPLLGDTPQERAAPAFLTHTGWTFGADTARVPPDGKDGHGQATGVPWYALLRQGDFKYIRTLVPGETEELYDLRRDPEELHNLARDPTHAVRLRELRQTALAELRRTEAPFVDVLPPVAGE